MINKMKIEKLKLKENFSLRRILTVLITGIMILSWFTILYFVVFSVPGSVGPGFKCFVLIIIGLIASMNLTWKEYSLRKKSAYEESMDCFEVYFDSIYGRIFVKVVVKSLYLLLIGFLFGSFIIDVVKFIIG